ncbi:MAG TPA: MBOAT family O-acyltransferase [Clostridia bacterium]|nr:MBOAT family O-acyltransferase [Clostridia bacterium]
MLFSSAVFLFFFLPTVLFCYYVFLRKSRLLQNIFLFSASLAFYAWGEPKFIFVMLLSIGANWFFGLMVARHKGQKTAERLTLTLAAVFNLGILFVFKYLMFSVESVNSLFALQLTVPVIALPIGISFFTFQAFSYVIDVSRGGGEVQKNPLYVGLYISFFPQLIAGPIVRYETIAEEIKNRRETADDFTSGVTRFIRGFLKKVLLANTMAIVADKAFEGVGSLSVAFAWLGAFAYAFQIYFDFSGYSDMAIGLGRMFGFHYLENFNYPYISKSISEFWRRWHISLGTWFRDYVYFPLGGGRVQSKARLMFNLFVVWFLTGMWHGANWTFILWGFMYFALITAEKLTDFENKFKKITWLKYIYTMAFVLFGWVIFRSPNLGLAGEYLKAMFGLAGNPLMDGTFQLYFTQYFLFFVLCALFSTPAAVLMREKIGKRCKARGFLYVFVMMALMIVAVSYVIKGSYNPFIYFNF